MQGHSLQKDCKGTQKMYIIYILYLAAYNEKVLQIKSRNWKTYNYSFNDEGMNVATVKNYSDVLNDKLIF